MDTNYSVLVRAIFLFISLSSLSPSDGFEASPVPPRSDDFRSFPRLPNSDEFIASPRPVPSPFPPKSDDFRAFPVPPKSDRFRAPPVPPTKLVNEFCNRKGTGMKKAFCLDILNSDPRTAYAHTYFTLFNVTMERAISDVTKTRRYFYNLRFMKPSLYRTLIFCVSRYDTVIKIFRNAIPQVARGKSDMDTVSYDVAMSYDYAAQCRERMDADGVRDGSLERMSGVVIDHTMVCYAIAVAVAEKSPT